MFQFDKSLTVYLHRPAIDFRTGINGLAILVEQSLGLSPFAAAVYVFSNRRRNRPRFWVGSATVSGCCSSGWSGTVSSGLSR